MNLLNTLISSLLSINDPCSTSRFHVINKLRTLSLHKHNSMHPVEQFLLLLHVNHLQQSYLHHTYCLHNHLPSHSNSLKQSTEASHTLRTHIDHTLNQHNKTTIWSVLNSEELPSVGILAPLNKLPCCRCCN